MSPKFNTRFGLRRERANELRDSDSADAHPCNVLCEQNLKHFSFLDFFQAWKMIFFQTRWRIGIHKSDSRSAAPNCARSPWNLRNLYRAAVITIKLQEAFDFWVLYLSLLLLSFAHIHIITIFFRLILQLHCKLCLIHNVVHSLNHLIWFDVA